MRLRPLLLLYTILSLIAGVIGGWAGTRFFGAPFYFGFFLAFTLGGMTGLFALAVHVENHRNKP